MEDERPDVPERAVYVSSTPDEGRGGLWRRTVEERGGLWRRGRIGRTGGRWSGEEMSKPSLTRLNRRALSLNVQSFYLYCLLAEKHHNIRRLLMSDQGLETAAEFISRTN